MKNGKLAISFLLILLFASVNLFANTNVVSEKVNEYLKNVKDREVGAIENVISEDAEFIRINKIIKSMETKDRSNFIKSVVSGQYSGWSKNTTVSLLDVQEQIAVALIEYENDTLIQKEYLTLVFSDNHWEIVHSVSALSKK